MATRIKKYGVAALLAVCISVQAFPLEAIGETPDSQDVPIDLATLAPGSYESFTVEADGSIVFGQEAVGKRFVATGTSSEYQFVVPSGLSVHLVLQQVTMSQTGASLIRLEPGAALQLGIMGQNHLQYAEPFYGLFQEESRAVIRVPGGARLTLYDASGDGSGALTVQQDEGLTKGYSAGIGGDISEAAGEITILGGTLEVLSFSFGAGIGGGAAGPSMALPPGNGGDINILGGSVSVTSHMGAAIGSGGAAFEMDAVLSETGNITIRDAEVFAFSDQAAALGGGAVPVTSAAPPIQSGGDIRIEGSAVVRAVSSQSNAVGGVELTHNGEMLQNDCQPTLYVAPSAQLQCLARVLPSAPGSAVQAAGVTGSGLVNVYLPDGYFPDPTATAATSIEVYNGQGQSVMELELPFTTGYGELLLQMYRCNALAYNVPESSTERYIHRVRHAGETVGVLVAENQTLEAEPSATRVAMSLADVPLLFTPTVVSAGKQSVLVQGTVAAENGAGLLSARFEIAKTADFAAPESYEWDLGGTAPVAQQELGGLAPGGEYYLRAYLENGNGGAYSGTAVLRTQPDGETLEWTARAVQNGISASIPLPPGGGKGLSAELQYSLAVDFTEYARVAFTPAQSGALVAEATALDAGRWYTRVYLSNQNANGLGGEDISPFFSVALGTRLQVESRSREGTLLQAEEQWQYEGEWYTPVPPAFTGYVFVGWQADVPAPAPDGFAVPDEDCAVSLLYGRDADGDGREDFAVRLLHVLEDTGTTHSEENLYINEGDGAPTPTELAGYQYTGWRVAGSAVQAGLPAFAFEAETHYNGTVEYLYAPEKAASEPASGNPPAQSAPTCPGTSAPTAMADAAQTPQAASPAQAAGGEAELAHTGDGSLAFPYVLLVLCAAGVGVWLCTKRRKI